MEADGTAASPVAQWLAGGMVLFTGVLTALGVSGGALERIMRNDPIEFFACFLLVVIAIGFGIIAPAVSTAVPDSRLVPGVVGLLVGLSGMGYLAVHSANTQERPRVNASVVTRDSGRLLLEGSASASGLRSDDYMLVRVEGHRNLNEALARFHEGMAEGNEKRAFFAYDSPQGYYQVISATRSGPDVNGTVSVPVKVELPAKLYDSVVVSAFLRNPDRRASENPSRRRCDRDTEYWGCVQVMVPGGPGGRTQLNDRERAKAAKQNGAREPEDDGPPTPEAARAPEAPQP